MRQSPAWLEKAVFYQIYPQTFADSNGDGIGDIPGIIQKLDYIASLGVTGIWLNPCFESPFLDAGYDVADYYQVAPRYGTNDDLRRLFAEARQRGLRILVDLVPGHTSIENRWFKESCRAARNPYTDWFIWTDSVWTPPMEGVQNVRGYAERNAAYIINFFYHQPALNYGFARPNPAFPWQQSQQDPGPQAVRQEIKKIMKFWLDMGASGFRVDMAGSLVKYDHDGSQTNAFWRWIRGWLDDEYPEAAIVSEWGNPPVAIPGAFHMDFYLPFAARGSNSLFRKSNSTYPGNDHYAWSYFDSSGRGNLQEFLDEYLRFYMGTKDEGFIAFISGNHDIHPRIRKGRTMDDLKVVFTFLLTMPGTPFIYYGDEIGMQHVEGLTSIEGSYDRTGVRTPMQWDGSANAGFSSAPAGQLYLPLDPDPQRPTVASQEEDPTSLLNHVRSLVTLRKEHPALCASGSFEVVSTENNGYPFVYRRSQGGENLLAAINPAAFPVQARWFADTQKSTPRALFGPQGVFSHDGDAWLLHMPPVSAGVYEIDA